MRPPCERCKLNHSYHYSDKPPYAERHVRWCERTEREIIPFLLLNFKHLVDDCIRKLLNFYFTVMCMAIAVLQWMLSNLPEALFHQFRKSLSKTCFSGLIPFVC